MIASNFFLALSGGMICIAAQLVHAAPAAVNLTVSAANGGMQLADSRETVQITFFGPGIVHVVATPVGAPAQKTAAQPWIIATCSPSKSEFGSTAKEAHAS